MGERRSNFFSDLHYFFRKKNLAIGLLGFSSGLPIMMTLSTLTYWLTVYGVDKKTVGLASLFALPYAFKFLWAPFLDLFQIPFFTYLGRRKSWIIFFQIILMLIFILLMKINPKENPYLVGLLIFSLSFASASQDIVVDAFRIDYLDEVEQSYASSSYQMCYRVAMLIMGAGVLFLSDSYSWSTIFGGVALLYLVIILLTFLINEPRKRESNETKENFSILLSRYIDGFAQFFKRKNALLILVFIVCYKLPDAISGVMVTNFYVDMKFTGAEIGMVSKIYGLIATLIGTFIAAGIITRLGIYQSLFITSILIGATNLLYLLALYNPPFIHSVFEIMLGRDLGLRDALLNLIFAITFENFVAGFASTLFILFLSLLCDREASATQYALLSSLAAVGVRFFGGGSGYLVEVLDWELFFIMTAFLFIPALFLLYFIRDEVRELMVVIHEKR